MSRFLNHKYRTLAPYTPGEQPKLQNLIKLNTNENPYGPGPKILQALSKAEAEKLMLYPDPDASDLVRAIAQYYQVKQEQVILGNGSDEILAFSFMAFQNEKRKFYFPSITYGFYSVYGQLFGTDYTEIPLSDDLTINTADYRNLDGTIVIANPAAPTGIALNPDEIEDILFHNQDNLVIIDEAYIDFGGKSCVRFVEKYDNLLIIQTFSKSRSLAGGRIGFAIGNDQLIADLNRIRFSFNPYNLNRLSILAGVAAIEDESYFQMTTNKIIKTRQAFTRELTALGFTVLPSSANFIFAKCNNLSGKEYFTKLRNNGILVRHFDKEPISDYVRISIGTEDQMAKLIEKTKLLLGGKDEKE